jgi:hypothetical protein
MALPGLIVDVSSNNSGPIDWVEAKQNGVIAAFVKATQGTGYTNPCFLGPERYDLRDALAAGIPAAAYHFAEFGDPSAEAAHFRAVAGSYAKVLDSETSTNAVWQQAFLDALNQPAGKVMDYGSTSSLPTGVRALLWGANYSGRPGPGEVCWQYSQTGSVRGIPGAVDLSQWLGTQEQFDVFFGLTPSFVSGGADMAATDPVSGGTWFTDPSGAVYAFDGAPYLGGLNNHPEWQAGAGQAEGPALGIAFWRGDGTNANGNGYIIATKDAAGNVHPYRFPRSAIYA